MKRFIKNAIRDGVSRGLGEAIGKAVSQAVEPTATELANKAAARIDRAAGSVAQESQSRFGGLGGLESTFANLERSLQGYATQMGQNMKICPQCGQPSGADKSFCPGCGAKLPEETVAQGAVCPNCGKQNNLGTKFCEDCGTKLPATVQAEEAALAKDAEELARWDELLWAFPKWSCGGSDYCIESYDPGQFMFSARFAGDHYAARNAVEQYRELLLQNGFREAGQYPSREHLYRMVDGICRHVDTEHCFDGDSDCPSIYFSNDEPYGGFDYKKPEPRKSVGLKDLFNL